MRPQRTVRGFLTWLYHLSVPQGVYIRYNEFPEN